MRLKRSRTRIAVIALLAAVCALLAAAAVRRHSSAQPPRQPGAAAAARVPHAARPAVRTASTPASRSLAEAPSPVHSGGWPAAPALPAIPASGAYGLVPNSAGCIALTFDACQTARRTGYDAGVVKALVNTRTPATLFLGGRWMESHQAETRHLASTGLFELANHSYLHRHLTRLSTARLRAELKRPQDIMYALTGRQGHLLRAPYGEYDARVLRMASELGLSVVEWDVLSGDPDRHVTAQRLEQTVLNRTRPGSIIIMHMNGRGWHTAEALPVIIRGLRQKGYRFVTVSDLPRLSNASSPRAQHQ